MRRIWFSWVKTLRTNAMITQSLCECTNVYEVVFKSRMFAPACNYSLSTLHIFHEIWIKNVSCFRCCEYRVRREGILIIRLTNIRLFTVFLLILLWNESKNRKNRDTLRKLLEMFKWLETSNKTRYCIQFLSHFTLKFSIQNTNGKDRLQNRKTCISFFPKKVLKVEFWVKNRNF